MWSIFFRLASVGSGAVWTNVVRGERAVFFLGGMVPPQAKIGPVCGKRASNRSRISLSLGGGASAPSAA